MPHKILRDTFVNGRYGKAAMVSSFGAESAVLLHMLAQVNPDADVLFVDTQMLFQETLDYQLSLAAHLGLVNVKTIRASEFLLRRQDAFGRLHLSDTDGCCQLRKIAPLEAALAGYDAWVSGRKRHQSDSRAGLALSEIAGGRVKLNPLANWQPEDIAAYFTEHDLPRHPLAAKGFGSIGCGPCTTPVAIGEDPRAGRWRGSDKVECGIHFEGGKIVRPAA